MKIRRIGKKFIFTAMAAAAISMPAVQLTAPVSVYAEETADVQSIAGQYTGRDTGFDITVTDEDGKYSIIVKSPADENGKTAEWTFSGAFDVPSKSLHYFDGVKTVYSSDDASPETVYENGTGSVIYKDGTLFWNNDAETEFTGSIWDKKPGVTDYSVSTLVYPGEDLNEHGQLTVDKTTAKGGDTVTVTVTPDDGYVLSQDKLYVLPEGKGFTDMIDTVETGDNTFTFTMPEENVRVYAAFMAEDSAPDFAFITGQWIGRADKKPTMEVVRNEDDSYHFTIDMPDEGDRMFRWTFNGDYDSTLGAIIYKDGKKFSYTAGDFSNTFDIIYENGRGSLINRGGLIWNSEGEFADTDMIFDRNMEYSYPITPVVEPDEDGNTHGSLKLDKSTAKPGETVTATVIPDEGYETSGFAISYEGEDNIEVKRAGENTYTFEMPAMEVEAIAYIMKAPSEIPAIEGAWANRQDSSNLMFISANPTGGFDVRIIVPSSDTEAAEYNFTGYFDPDLKRIGFDSREMNLLRADENGNVVKTAQDEQSGGSLVYKDGVFFLNISGDSETQEPIQFAKLDSTYEIKTKEAENGSVDIDKKLAYPGEYVIIKTQPANGFVTQTVSVLDKDGKEVELKKLGANAFAFIMPDGEVNVSASFKAPDTGANTDPVNNQGGASSNTGNAVPANNQGAASSYTGNVVSTSGAKTGDSNMLPLWISVAAASAGAAVTLLAVKKREENK